MAEERLVISINEKGSLVVQRNMKKLGKTAAKTGSQVNLLKKAVVALGAVLTFQTLIKATRLLADFGQTMATVKAVTNATETEFVQLRETAKSLGETTRFSATQVAEGLLFLGRAGFGAQGAIESVDDTLKLAQAGMLDLGTAADIVTNVLTGFRGDTSQLSKFVDVLAKAANSSNTNIQQLGEAMKFAAPVAAGLGVSVEEAAAAAGTLSNAGLQASLAGTGLRRVMATLEKPTGAAAKVLKELGVNAEDVRVSQIGLSEALKRLRAAGIDTGQALALFGQRGGPAFDVLVNFIPELDRMTESLQNSEGEADRVAKTMDDTLMGALLRVKSASEAVVINFGDLGTESALTNMMNQLAEAIRFVAKNLDIVGVVFKAIFEELMIILEPFEPLFNAIGKTAVEALKQAGLAFLGLLRTAATVADTFIAVYADIGRTIFDNLGGAIDIFLMIVISAVNSALALLGSLVNGFIIGLNPLLEFFGKDPIKEFEIFQIDADEVIKVGRELADGILTGMEQTDFTGAVDRIITKVQDAIAAKGGFVKPEAEPDKPPIPEDLATAGEEAVQAFAFEALLVGLREEAGLLRLSNEERAIRNGLKQAEAQLGRPLNDQEKLLVENQLASNIALAEQLALLEQIRGPQQQFERNLAALNQLYIEEEINIDQYNAALENLLETQKKAATAEGGLGEDILGDVFSNATRGLEDFQRTWRDFVGEVLADIARIAQQQIITRALGALSPLPGFQHGGSFGVGGAGGPDSQMVQFMASPGERVDVLTRGQQQQQATAAPPVINIINVTDPSEIPEAMASAEGEQAIINVVSRNRTTMKQALA